jgi:hypothetical protein
MNRVKIRGKCYESFSTNFFKSARILPVIHVDSVEQALRNAEIARESLCDGVFLINHGLALIV